MPFTTLVHHTCSITVECDSNHNADAVSDVAAGNVSGAVLASQKPTRKRRRWTGKSERRDDSDASSAANNDEKRVKRHAQSRSSAASDVYKRQDQSITMQHSNYFYQKHLVYFEV